MINRRENKAKEEKKYEIIGAKFEILDWLPREGLTDVRCNKNSINKRANEWMSFTIQPGMLSTIHHIYSTRIFLGGCKQMTDKGTQTEIY